MSNVILELNNITKIVNQNTPRQTTIMDNVNLRINNGDFITVVGTNGAGKSTLFNIISGVLPVTAGKIILKNKDITKTTQVNRSKFIGQVFQDPKMGTAPRMNVAENLLLAKRRGMHRTLTPRHLKQNLPTLKQLAATMNNGLENRLLTATEFLSGGQRQALSFLMATIKKPDILLLDEHTAALDPKTSQKLMATTNRKINDEHLTSLMITHNMENALTYGNRLIVLDAGRIIADYDEQAKSKLTLNDLTDYFA